MKKTEILPIVVIGALLFAWGPASNYIYYDMMGNERPKPVVKPIYDPSGTNTTGIVSTFPNAEIRPAQTSNGVVRAVSAPGAANAVAAGEASGAAPKLLSETAFAEGNTIVLENDSTSITFTKMGGAIAEVVLASYPAVNEKGSGPVTIRSGNRIPLSLVGVQKASVAKAFDMKVEVPGKTVKFSTDIGGGCTLERVITLADDGYTLDVTDTFINGSATDLEIPSMGVDHGEMHLESKILPFIGNPIGMSYREQVGAKVRSKEGDKVKKLLAKDPASGMSYRKSSPIDFFAVRNKFFASIISLNEDSAIFSKGYEVDGAIGGNEKGNITRIAGTTWFDSLEIPSGKRVARQFDMYIGPRKLSRLTEMRLGQERIMGFNILTPICKVLLWLLNMFFGFVKNYGVAIILLTVFVRLIFWPLTNKGHASMKKMQALQPQIKAINEKYKSDPQRKSSETMALYKKNKVNPVGGCLPIMIQMPVLFSLFFVIRAAVELRFAKFLWIKDLSAPEGLFESSLGVPINFLPFAMAGTSMLQQKLTPSSMDPMQRKMMMFMPAMFAVIGYNWPSGLLLYWTTSNALMILQQLMSNRKHDHGDVAVIDVEAKDITPGLKPKVVKKKPR